VAKFLNLLFAGIAVGSIYGISALGFLLLYKATGVINFAHGSFTTLAAYLGVWAVADLALPVGLGYAVSLAIMFAAGVTLERTAYAPLRGRSLHVVVISTFGAATVITALLALWKGPGPLQLPGLVGNGAFHLGGAVLSYQKLLIVGVTLFVLIGMSVAFYAAPFGRQLRALAFDREAAVMVGVRAKAISMVAFGLSAVLAGMAGLLIGPLSAVDIQSSFGAMLGAFSAAIIGGFGNLYGVLAGGILIGLVGQLLGGYLFPNFSQAYPYILLIAVIALRPEGLFAPESRARL
jgi:branched-chain amino acid transport system permease protein